MQFVVVRIKEKGEILFVEIGLIKKGDHIHCCPKDHTCDEQSGRCRRKIDQLNNIICPDGNITFFLS